MSNPATTHPGKAENGVSQRFPAQIKYIIGNEVCERFSYYGMKSILAGYISGEVARGGLAQSEDKATQIIHLFVFANYFAPLFGAWVSDRFWGRYSTILWISLFYCLGHGVLAMSDLFGDTSAKLWCLYSGLTLIAFGAGGIKPCVSAFVGDQFPKSQSHLLQKAYSAFYWSINFGSFFSFLLIPRIKDAAGYGWAFGVPGILMAIATAIFYAGTRHYVRVPPLRESRQPGYMAIFMEALRNRKPGRPFWDGARARFGDEAADAAASVGPVLKVFCLIPVFWALFDQSSSTWVLQGFRMQAQDVPTGFQWLTGKTLGAEQMQSMNPLMVMLLVPLLTLVVYPRLERFTRVTALRRISFGLSITGFSYVLVAWIQHRLDAGETMSVLWQTWPYLVLTLGEVLVSISGLEFAYTQAAASMKSTIMSFWMLTVAAGNLLVSLITALGSSDVDASPITVDRFLLYAGMTFVVAVLFHFLTRNYQYRKETPPA